MILKPVIAYHLIEFQKTLYDAQHVLRQIFFTNTFCDDYLRFTGPLGRAPGLSAPASCILSKYNVHVLAPVHYNSVYLTGLTRSLRSCTRAGGGSQVWNANATCTLYKLGSLTERQGHVPLQSNARWAGSRRSAGRHLKKTASIIFKPSDNLVMSTWLHTLSYYRDYCILVTVFHVSDRRRWRIVAL